MPVSISRSSARHFTHSHRDAGRPAGEHPPRASRKVRPRARSASDAEEAQVSRRASERHKMAALCAHMGASIAEGGRREVDKKPLSSVARPDAARASAAGVPGRVTRWRADWGAERRRAGEEGARGKVRAPESGIRRPPLSHSLDKEGLGLKSVVRSSRLALPLLSAGDRRGAGLLLRLPESKSRTAPWRHSSVRTRTGQGA